MQHESVDVEANDIICHMTCLVTERNIQNQSKNMEIRRSKIQKFISYHSGQKNFAMLTCTL